MKKLLTAVAALFAVVSMASALEMQWGNKYGSPALDEMGSNLNGGTAYLVYLGTNGSLDASFNGTSWDLGDDQIVGYKNISGVAQTSYSSSWGYFKTSSPIGTAKGSVYAIIATSDGVDGTALPTTGYYGVSSTYVQQKDGVTDSDEFFLTSSVNVSTLIGVPEPTTYALVGLAAAALALRKRFLKK